MTSVPDIRIRIPHPATVRPDRDYVLYWMTAFRRLGWSFALDQAAGWARELGKPLVILEPLRAGYPWASDRFHRFVIDGMAEHARRLQKSRVLYYPYVEPEPGAGKGLLEALARRACVVVTDDYPAFFLPRMVDAAGKALTEAGVRLEVVDSNGLLPLRAAGRTFTAAYHFRRFLQKELPHHLGDMPAADPLAEPLPARLKSLPQEILQRWPAASADLLAGNPKALAVLAALPIDHSVPPVAGVSGGDAAGAETLERFLDERLERYGEGRNHPVEDITSRLSPHLHFGTVSAHQMLAAVAMREDWAPDRLSDRTNGKREGWWGMSPSAEKFLDEAITWREIGFNLSSQNPDYDRYESLPDWAQETLRRHVSDPRPHVYTVEQFEAGETEDVLWNAAQGQLREEGRIHNYLRMLWGKKVLHWSKTPQEAVATLIHLNNKYALDGRDPNSYSGIFWCFGRFDRPWAPERPVFGSVRYMSTESTRRKLKVDSYVERYASGKQAHLFPGP